jgi:hypothetical protein
MARRHNPSGQAVALMDRTPAQVARAHADEVVATFCELRAIESAHGLKPPNLSEIDRQYLEALVARFNALSGRLRGITP